MTEMIVRSTVISLDLVISLKFFLNFDARLVGRRVKEVMRLKSAAKHDLVTTSMKST